MNELAKTVGASPDPRGIKSFRDWRFYPVALLLCGSLLCLIRDPYFISYGEFVYRQGVMVLLLALTVAAAFLWETPIFGKPAGANLLLQSFSIAPFSLLVARLCASDGTSSQELTAPRFSGVWSAVGDMLYKVVEIVPAWLRDMFSNWQITLLFLLVLAILCVRDIRFRTGAIGRMLLVLFAGQHNRGGELGHLTGAALLLVTALSFMFSRYDKVSYFENVLKRLRRSGTIDAEELRAVLLVMEQLARKKRLSEGNYRQIVKDCYASAEHPRTENELNLISGELAKRMIHNHDLVSLRNDSEGIFLFPDPLLFQDENLLSAVAVVPRIIFVGFFALLWVIMPFDLIPDSLPLVGTLDDISVMILSGIVIQSSSMPMRKRHE